MSDQDQQSLKEGTNSNEKVYGSARLDRNEKEQLSNVKVIGVVGGPVSEGTLIKRISEKYNCSVIGYVDLVTKKLSENTELGKEIKGMLETGKTIPKEIGWDLIIEATKIALAEKNDYIIFNGSYKILQVETFLIKGPIFPISTSPISTSEIIETFEKYLKPCDLILNLEIDENAMKKRMQQRANIEGCIDDKNIPSYENMKIVENHLALYKENIDLILKEAEERNYKHVEIDAAQSEDDIFKNICNEIEKLEESKYSIFDEFWNDFSNFVDKIWPNDDDNGEGTSNEERDVVRDTAFLACKEKDDTIDTILTEVNSINSKLDLMISNLDLIKSALMPPNNENPDPKEEK